MSDISGSHLLVPIVVEALVVSDLDQTGGDTEWSLGAANYEWLTLLQMDPGPAPFNNGPPAAPPTGVTLSWSLPSGLTTGVTAQDGSTAYPTVPDRWLVVRMYPDAADPTARRTRAWVVQSDYVWPTGTAPAATTNVLSPTTPGQVISIGRVLPLTGDPDVAPPVAPSPLTAVGPGDVSFAAFAPGCPSVFSMQDDLSDLPDSPPAPIYLTYLVVGWYADPADDVLAAASPVDADDWANVASAYTWSVGDEQDLPTAVSDTAAWLTAQGQPATAPCPTQTLCHGMVYSVPWLGAGAFPADGSSPPRWRAGQYTPAWPADPQFAVGNNAAEALAAYLAQALDSTVADQLETILLAFQYSLLGDLDGPDAQNQLDRGIQAAPFGHQGAGTVWAAVQADPTPAPSGSVPNPSGPPALTAEQTEKLTALNHAQHDLDTAAGVLASRQQLLYSLSWQAQNGADGAAAAISAVESNIDALSSTIDQLRTTIGTLAAELGVALGDVLGAGSRLVEQPRPSWYHPSDPVLLISGVGRSYTYAPPPGAPADTGTSLTYDPPGADPGDVLFCRFSGQTIASLTVADPAGGSSVTIGATELQGAGLFAPVQSPLVPAEVADLCIEAYLLDTTNATALAGVAAAAFSVEATAALAQTIQIQQTLVWNADTDPALDQQTLASAAGLNGLYGEGNPPPPVVPSLLSVSYWATPWTPVFLDWDVSFYALATDPAGALAPWAFDGIDYAIQQAVATESPVQTYQGRTVLTANATRALRQQLVTFLNGPAFQKALVAEGIGQSYGPYIASQLVSVVQSMDEWDIIAQSFGGLTEMFRQLVPGWAPILSDGTAPYLEDARLMTAQPAYPFIPLRAGALEVTRMSVVDTFGQSFPVTNNVPLACFRSQALTPPAAISSTPAQMYLPPRLTAPSRLLCDLRDAWRDSVSVAFNPGTSPLCGWIVPNCLDGALSVFDGDGILLGEMFTTEGGTPQVEWIAAPGTATTPAAIANPTLNRFVNGLLTPGLDGGTALNQLIDSIDEAAWSSVPRSSTNLTNLGNLIGRPLALARADIGLDFPGDPPFNQSTTTEGISPATLVSALVDGDASDLATVTAGLLKVAFPIHLGAPASPDDGLVGFCADADLVDGTYQTFYSACPVSTAQTYVNNNPEISVSFATSQLVALLVDPFAGVVLTSGILPDVRMTLPDGVVNEALANMQVAFRTGPMLAQPASMQMPLPSNIAGTWAWMAQAPPGTWTTTQSLGQVDNLPNLSVDPTLMTEGWLVLSGALDLPPATPPEKGGSQ